MSIESELETWKEPNNQVKSVIEAINSEDNAIFCVNTIHIISQMADILTNACGGLLPLLASATTVNVYAKKKFILFYYLKLELFLERNEL